ncbi:hypothetical protein FQR65_LT11006 [Abscondita terminalis]|nr:hypothetical protein FQR65_LT11006 [Abscondita terminalis]
MHSATFLICAVLIAFVPNLGFCSFCDDKGCCSTTECNICAAGCYNNCTTESCEKSCISNCIFNPSINVCDGPNCCRTLDCTNCVHICTSECPTQICKKSCIYNCIKGVSSHCSESGCCTTQKCDGCAQNCINNCHTQTCTHDCVENCVQDIQQVCDGRSCSYCSDSGCCSNGRCNNCAKSCIAQCSTVECKQSCIDNCLQNIPQHCEGPQCNACTGATCCNSQQCNNCARACTSQCNTLGCSNSCIQKCLRTTPACSGPSCNLCVGKNCCTSNNCNTCVNQCYNQNSPNTCTNACVQNCINTEPTKFVFPIPQYDCGPSQPEPISPHQPPVNVQSRGGETNITTHIVLHNIINNTNIINIPININSTNHNNINIKQSKSGKSSRKCCYVVHPKECFVVPRNVSEFEGIENVNNTLPDIKCIRRRHKECSSICTSPVVLIQQMPPPVYIPPPYSYQPVPQSQPQCQFISQYPWQYCGNYQKHDCGSCYYCGENYNPQQCSMQTNCSEPCRNNLFVQ